jgi:MFS transporter, DHA3 family, macrolide efflux protein
VDARLRLLLPVFAGANLCILGLYVVGIPLFVKEGLGGDARDLGLVVGALGAGLMIGTLALPRFPAWITSSMAGLFTLFALSDLGLAFVGLAPSVFVACAAFFASGLCVGPASTLYQAMLQTTTPPEYLGRVIGMSRAISFGVEPVAAAAIGQLSKVLSSGVLVLASGLAAMTIDLFALVRGRALDRTVPG